MENGLDDLEKQIFAGDVKSGNGERIEDIKDYGVFKINRSEEGEEKANSYKFKSGIRKTYSSPIKRQKVSALGNQVGIPLKR